MKFNELKEKGLVIKEYVVNNKVISIVLGISLFMNVVLCTSCSSTTNNLNEARVQLNEEQNKYDNLSDMYDGVVDENQELERKVTEADVWFELSEEEREEVERQLEERKAREEEERLAEEKRLEEERLAKEEAERKAKEEEEKKAQEIQDESLNEEMKNGEYQVEDSSDGDVAIIEAIAEDSFGASGYDYKVFKQDNMIVLQIKLDNNTLASGQYAMAEWNNLVDNMVVLSGSASGITSCKFVVTVTDYNDNCYITAMDGVLYIDVHNGINRLN